MTGVAETVSDRKAMILAMALSKARARRQREHPDWPQDAISDEDYAKIIEEYERLTGLAEPATTIAELVASHDCGQQIVPGTDIRSRTDRADGEIMSFRWCFECCKAMARYDEDGGAALDARQALRYPELAAIAASQRAADKGE